MNSSPSSPSSASPARETKVRTGAPDFTYLFCEKYRCLPSEYEQRAFRECLYWHARLLAPLLRAIRPSWFEPDLALIRYLAKSPGRRNAINELAAFMEANNTRGSFARKTLRLRISAWKTGRLIVELFSRHPDPDKSPSDPPTTLT